MHLHTHVAGTAGHSFEWVAVAVLTRNKAKEVPDPFLNMCHVEPHGAVSHARKPVQMLMRWDVIKNESPL